MGKLELTVGENYTRRNEIHDAISGVRDPVLEIYQRTVSQRLIALNEQDIFYQYLFEKYSPSDLLRSLFINFRLFTTELGRRVNLLCPCTRGHNLDILPISARNKDQKFLRSFKIEGDDGIEVLDIVPHELDAEILMKRVVEGRWLLPCIGRRRVEWKGLTFGSHPIGGEYFVLCGITVGVNEYSRKYRKKPGSTISLDTRIVRRDILVFDQASIDSIDLVGSEIGQSANRARNLESFYVRHPYLGGGMSGK